VQVKITMKGRPSSGGVGGKEKCNLGDGGKNKRQCRKSELGRGDPKRGREGAREGG